ncbi:uncharacterized protein LOC129590122 [Paramacrobiotus metropolitanus]|uniref:uncharacterized protein LOC129590122 n=1 Tax=Paramacrobiotus metropolitanus TaxID=2943436 RepID=UPI002445DD6D|nr:uncharacterized protein LOC129590122 [Paramacrobiotus metropolitanus]
MAKAKTPKPKSKEKGKSAPKKGKSENAKAKKAKPKKDDKKKDEPKKTEKKKGDGSKKTDKKKGGGGWFGGGGDGKNKKKDKKGGKDKSDRKAKEDRAKSPTESPNGSPKGSPKRSPSPTGDTSSRKLRFDSAVRVKEIPDRFGTPSQTSATGSRPCVSLRSFPPEGSELDTSTKPKYSDPYFGSKVSSRIPCPKESEKKEPDLYSTRSMTLDEPGPIFNPNRCPTYSREELISLIETLVLGINDRESLKTRYDEENTRLAMNAEFYADKELNARSRLECLRNKTSEIDNALRESVDLMSRNYVQLTRERKRIAGAIDLREDFDRHLQDKISTNTKYVQDYAIILGKLQGLLDDSSMAWLQRETMLSTESEALEKLHGSVEKEKRNLTSELHKYQALYVSQSTQNGKLGEVVERELERYMTKQQEVLKYNEKRVKALEGCVRTMQLDREVMYSEIAEQRNRLKDILENQVINLMNKVRYYKDALRGLEEELSKVTCRTEGFLAVSDQLKTYVRLVSNIDVLDFANKVQSAKAACDEVETAWRTKNCERRDLTDIRRLYVDRQRQKMLATEDEYFLMEPVDVPGAESHTNFQRSIECFLPEGSTCYPKSGPGERPPPRAIQMEIMPAPPPTEAPTEASYRSAGEDMSTGGTDRPLDVSRNDDSASTRDWDARSMGKKVMGGVKAVISVPKKTADVLTWGLRKFGNLAHLPSLPFSFSHHRFRKRQAVG